MRIGNFVRRPGAALWLGCTVWLAGCDPSFEPREAAEAAPRETSAWPEYGGGGGRKFVAQGPLGPENVGELELAWTYRTGEQGTIFQNTPVLVAGRLMVCSPYNNITALDPLTGGELWRYDAQLDREANVANQFNCRAIAQWHDPQAPDICTSRVIMATNDARLIALDAASGTPCYEFGNQGAVDLRDGVGSILWSGEYQVTSPPLVHGDTIVVGSAISDGNRIDAPSGVVRGFDVRTGALRWAFDLAPPEFDYATQPVSSAGHALGTPNVWAAMSSDPERDLVFLPTGNPAPDYYRDTEPDMGYYGSSVIALRGSTGEVVWHYQTVRKDFWDYDVPSQPALADIELNGATVPVVVQATKMGFIFVLHRETGEPVVPVAETTVPVYGPSAAQMSSTQPFPPAAFQVSRSYERFTSLLGACDGMDEASVTGPVYTPITEDWTIGLPSNMGATNWGGVAVDPVRGLIAVRTSNVPFRTKLISRADASDLVPILRDRTISDEERSVAWDTFNARYDIPEDVEVAPQNGVDYLMARHTYLDPWFGLPCGNAPMGEIMIIDIAAGERRWQREHGTLRDIVGVPIELGLPGVGGPLLTDSGLMIVGGIAERALRAYSVADGTELWRGRLPAPAMATPMSYTVQTPEGERQFVVVAAGGDDRVGLGGVGDYVVAFATQAD